MPTEDSIAKVKSAVEGDWMKVVKAEERSKLLRELVRQGLGTNDVENFVKGQGNLRFEIGKGRGGDESESKMDRENVINLMKTKLENSLKDENEKGLRRNKSRAKLERILAKKKNAYKRFIHNMREKVSKENIICLLFLIIQKNRG